jgi:hypothetical protein
MENNFFKKTEELKKVIKVPNQKRLKVWRKVLQRGFDFGTELTDELLIQAYFMYVAHSSALDLEYKNVFYYNRPVEFTLMFNTGEREMMTRFIQIILSAEEI